MSDTAQLNETTSERYLSFKEAAQELDIHYLSVRSYVRQGYILTRQFGKRYRIAESEIARFKAYGNYPAGAISSAGAALENNIGPIDLEKIDLSFLEDEEDDDPQP